MAKPATTTGLRRVIGPRLLLVFIVGDILGTGIYALIGQVAGEVGGAVWLPFLLAFLIATPTALSYLELVTKYPQAAGSANYANRAFGRRWITFLVGFAVLASVIGSAATGARVFAAHLATVLHWETTPATLTFLSLGVVGTVMLVNLWGVRESLIASVVITAIELSGLLIVIVVGLLATSRGDADLSRSFDFDAHGGQPAIMALLAATSLAFFAMVGFEDSVNLAEETRNPTFAYPRAILGGLAITATLYVLVSIFAVAVVPPAGLAGTETPLTLVVARGLPGLPVTDMFAIITMCALVHTTLLNMLTASRLVYGLAEQGVLPRPLSGVLSVRRTPWVAILVTTAVAGALVSYVARVGTGAIGLLAGTTSLLHLAVFSIVNIAVLMLRNHPVGHRHFRTNAALAAGAAVVCVALTTPLTGRDPRQYLLAGALLGVGMALAIPALRSPADDQNVTGSESTP
jgi:APA family basic amino acid/polyamine antiporter